MVTISAVYFISSPGNFTKYAFTTNFITDWFGVWLILFVVEGEIVALFFLFSSFFLCFILFVLVWFGGFFWQM